MPKKLFLLLFLLFASANNMLAQYGVSNEIGVIAGPINFRSDYGARNSPETISKSLGYSFGIVHYLNFTKFSGFEWYARQHYFSEHFRMRSELSYCKADLDFFGKWVAPDKTSIVSEQLRAIHGSTSLANLGVQLEFYPLGITDFSLSLVSFSPFVSFGIQYSYYKPVISSSLGPLDTPISTPPKYFGATSNKAGYVGSIVSSIGTRYKLTDSSDLLVELRGQFYFSDWVDGLKPDKKQYPENKHNDWNMWLNFGYIYYLQ